MGKDIDLRVINGLRTRLLNAIDQISDIKSKVIKKYVIKLRDEFDWICQTEIDKFYSSYPHPRYNRYGDLFHVYQIKINKFTGEFSIVFDSNFMKYLHRVSNEYIYENSFMHGYHGGADKGGGGVRIIDGIPYNSEPHPNPGTPYWKNPFTNYTTWLRPAKKSDSPYENIMERIKEKEKEINDDFEEELNERILQLLTPIKRDMIRYLK